MQSFFPPTRLNRVCGDVGHKSFDSLSKSRLKFFLKIWLQLFPTLVRTINLFFSLIINSIELQLTFWQLEDIIVKIHHEINSYDYLIRKSRRNEVTLEMHIR